MTTPALRCALRAAPSDRPPQQAERTYLHPGQLAALDGPGLLTTILGSCVGVCLHDPEARVGGLNHFLLPSQGGGDSARYGDVAMPRLVELVEQMGGRRSRMVATIVGGACVLDGFRGRAAELGQSNVRLARIALDAMGIAIIAEHVGGTRGRRVVFEPVSGEITVHVLQGAE